MSRIAIIGAGALGGALAHKLASRGRVAEVRLIDPSADVARGKALDIAQSAPVDGFSTAVTTASDPAAAAGADAIVLADLVADGEIAGETGLALVRQLARVETASPLVFAGSTQRELMGRCASELRLDGRRLLGTAPAALESAVKAVTAALLDRAPRDLALIVAGVPPAHAVIGWDGATASGQPIAAQLAPHHMLAISTRLPGLWPPGPFALASAGAPVCEALAHGSRRLHTSFAVLDRTSAGRHVIAAVPVEIQRGGIARIAEPALSGRERTAFENGLG